MEAISGRDINLKAFILNRRDAEKKSHRDLIIQPGDLSAP
jgi:hypothetical protein